MRCEFFAPEPARDSAGVDGWIRLDVERVHGRRIGIAMYEQSLAYLRPLLRPILKLCLRHSIRLQELTECIKSVLLEVAEEELTNAGHVLSASKLSAMTGVHRLDVTRIWGKQAPPKQSSNLIARVIGHWQQDSRFCGANGRARTLTFDSQDSEFVNLVRSVSADLNSYTVLFELERVGAVARTKHGLKLTSRVYIPRGDAVEGFEMLGRDTEDLLLAAEENYLREPAIPNLHLKTEYDRVPAQYADKIRTWFIDNGSAFHQRARNFLSKFDFDLNPRLKGADPCIRIAIGTFSLVEPSNQKPNNRRGK